MYLPETGKFYFEATPTVLASGQTASVGFQDTNADLSLASQPDFALNRNGTKYDE